MYLKDIRAALEYVSGRWSEEMIQSLRAVATLPEDTFSARMWNDLKLPVAQL